MTQKRRKIFAVLAIFLLAPVLSYIYLARYQFVVTPDVATATIETRGLPVQVSWPAQGISAIGATGYGLLADSGAKDKAVPIASITKLFTALAVLEKKPLADGNTGELIAITPADEAFYRSYMAQGGSVLPVTAGQQISQYQLMQALLIPSANNAADTLVNWAFGSMDAYLTYANDMVARMGLEYTVISDASGFSPATIGSATDLIKLGEVALKHPIIAGIVRQPSAQVNGVTIQSTNKLLGQQGIIGGKTGNTDQAGDCMLFFADYDPSPENKVTIIGVVLGQTNRQTTFARIQTLLASAQQGFGEIEVVKAGDVVGHYTTPWNTRTAIVAERALTVFGWLGSTYTPEFKINPVTAGSSANHVVGSAQIKNQGKTYLASLSLQEPLTKPSMLWRYSHIHRLSSVTNSFVEM
jgi:serine-type D-Ala-D-Ala carboxypeptidase (penicillin-binding protein 5/6)